MSQYIRDYTLQHDKLFWDANRKLSEHKLKKGGVPLPGPSDANFLKSIASLDDTNVDFKSVSKFFVAFQKLFVKMGPGNRYFAYSPKLGVEDVTDLKKINGKMQLLSQINKETEYSIRWRVLQEMFGAEDEPEYYGNPFTDDDEIAFYTPRLTVVSEGRLMGPVQRLSDPSHSMWVEIGDNSIKVCDPNIEGLQAIATLEIINFANDDANLGNPEGWCQTWSTFAIECLARGSTLHNDLVKCCRDNQFMMDSDLGKRFVQLFDPEGFKAGFNTKALTTFIRKYALRINNHFNFKLPKIKNPQPKKDPLDPKYKDQLAEYKKIIPPFVIDDEEPKSRHEQMSKALTEILLYYKKTDVN